MKTIKMIILLSLFASTFFTLYAQDNSKLRVAVFDPSSSGTSIDEGTKIAVRELISSTFVNTGKYIIVERSLLDRIMREQEFSNSGAVDDSQATEVGKLAGANKVIMSVVTLVGGRNMLSIKIIDVQTATIDQQKTKIVNSNDLLDIVEPLTAELLGEKAPEPAQNTVKGNATSENFTPVPATGDEAVKITEPEQLTDRKSGQDCACEVQTEDAIQKLHPSFIQKREREILKNIKKSGGVFTDSRAAALNSFCPEGWRAPTFAELQCIYRNKDKIGGFGNGGNYYSSKFNRLGSAGIDFDSGKEKTINGYRTANLRCVRCQQDKGFEGSAKPDSASQMMAKDPVNEKDRELALSSPNSYEIAGSVSNLIFDAIKDSKKSGKYKNDEERFANLKDRGQIRKNIQSEFFDKEPQQRIIAINRQFSDSILYQK